MGYEFWFVCVCCIREQADNRTLCMSVTPYLYSLSLFFSLSRSGIAVSGIICVQSLLFSSCALHPGLALWHDAECQSLRHWSYGAQAKSKSGTNESPRFIWATTTMHKCPILFLSRDSSCLKTIWLNVKLQLGYFKSNELFDNKYKSFDFSPLTLPYKVRVFKVIINDQSRQMISKAKKHSLCWVYSMSYCMKYLQNSEYFSSVSDPLVLFLPQSPSPRISEILCFWLFYWSALKLYEMD